MMTIEKLPTMPYAQAKIVKDENKVELVSYQTTVATVDIATGWTRCYGLYSATTRKHISAFCKEFAALTYDIMKMCYKQNLKYNIYTGELAAI